MYKNSKYTVLFPLLLAAGVVLGLLLGQYMGRNSTTSEIKGMLRQMALPTNKLTYTLSLIENQYVDSVAMDSLAEHVIPLLVKELDPHSVYIPASEMQEINEPLEGEFDGIGVVFNMATDTVIVLNVIPQGPSDKAGIKGFGLIDIDDAELWHYFPEMMRVAPECRFYNCTHTHEPGCAVVEAVREGKIAYARYESYLKILDEDEKYRK